MVFGLRKMERGVIKMSSSALTLAIKTFLDLPMDGSSFVVLEPNLINPFLRCLETMDEGCLIEKTVKDEPYNRIDMVIQPIIGNTKCITTIMSSEPKYLVYRKKARVKDNKSPYKIIPGIGLVINRTWNNIDLITCDKEK